MDAAEVRRGRRYRVVAAAGLACYGLVYLGTALLALEVAAGREVTASSRGALVAVAHAPLGQVLVLAVGVALFGLASWQVIEAAIGREGSELPRWTRRVSALGRGVTYLALGVLAVLTVLGVQGPSGLGETVTGRLMASSAGGLLLAGIGAGILAVGVSQVVRGVRRSFRYELDESPSARLLTFGVAGYLAKGLVLALIGALLVGAVVAHDPTQIGGMDAALARLRHHRYGAVLLSVIAGGLGCFGLYCLAGARQIASRTAR